MDDAADATSRLDYRIGNDIDLDVVIELYKDSTLGARRPVDDRARMKQMLERANLVVTAWEKDTNLLVGIARSLSDFCFATYLSDMAVRLSWQRKGVGRELVRRTQTEGGNATIFLFAAPAAVDYYPRVGFNTGSGWILPPTAQVR